MAGKKGCTGRAKVHKSEATEKSFAFRGGDMYPRRRRSVSIGKLSLHAGQSRELPVHLLALSGV